MARFRYKMQSILDIKEKLETKAKQDFAQANQRLMEEEEKLDALKRRKEAYLEEGIQIRLQEIDVRKIRENKMAVMKMDEYILQQSKEIAKAQKQVERARAALQQVMQERKVHEKLKEKAFQEFMKEEQQKENSQIDELTTYLHGQKVIGERDDG